MPTCWRIWRLNALLVRSWLVVRMCLANKVMSLSIRWATATLAKDAWLVVALRFSKALLMRQGPLPQSSPKLAAVALLGVVATAVFVVVEIVELAGIAVPLTVQWRQVSVCARPEVPWGVAARTEPHSAVLGFVVRIVGHTRVVSGMAPVRCRPWQRPTRPGS